MGLLCMDNLGFDASPIELNSAGKHRQLVSWIWILICLPEKINSGICACFSPDSDFLCPFKFHNACTKHNSTICL